MAVQGQNWSDAEKILERVGVNWEIPNCASLATRRYLFQSARDLNARRVFEIGTYLGVSTLALALGAEFGRVLTVDLTDVLAPNGYWAMEKDSEGRNLLGASPAVLWDHGGVGGRVDFLHAPAPQCLRWLRGNFDLVFVDAWKHEDVVYDTLVGCLPLVRSGGVILVHDVYPNGEKFREGITSDPGPWRAVERLRRSAGGIYGLKPEASIRLIRELPTGGEDRMAEIRI